MDNDTPRFTHDCDHCVFLGRYSGEGRWAGEYDLYAHPGEGISKTVIARWNGDGGNYFSGLHFALPYTDFTGQDQPGIPPLVEALRRAKEKGLM